MLRALKRMASVVLGAAFFLPLSKCSRVVVEPGGELHAIPVDTVAYSAYDWPSIGSTVALILFFWPLAVQCLAWKRAPLVKRAIWAVIVEFCVCLLTLAGISWLTFVLAQGIRYGALVAYAAIATYAGALIAELSRRRL
jgi:hypothetical protein